MGVRLCLGFSHTHSVHGVKQCAHPSETVDCGHICASSCKRGCSGRLVERNVYGAIQLLEAFIQHSACTSPHAGGDPKALPLAFEFREPDDKVYSLDLRSLEPECSAQCPWTMLWRRREQVRGRQPPSRAEHCAVVLGEEMVVFGGNSLISNGYLNDVWVWVGKTELLTLKSK